MSVTVTIREARPEDATGIARVHVDSWTSTYRGIVPDEVLDGLSYEAREDQRRKIFRSRIPGAFSLVAEDENGGIVGFADAGPERKGDPEYDSELYAIYLPAEAQGRGIGRSLFEEVVRRLRANRYRGMMLWVLAENPSRGFYARMGGQPVRRQTSTIGKELEEIGYGWSLKLSDQEGQED
jgi:GNAT superfamily N-acetyltransferase